MKYMVAYYNEYFDGGICISILDDRRAIELVRRYYEFTKDITTVADLADYYIDNGIVELNGDTMITIKTLNDNVVMLSIY